MKRGQTLFAAALFTLAAVTAVLVAMSSHGRAPRPSPLAAGSFGGAPSASVSPIPTIVGPWLRPSRPITLEIPAIGAHASMLTLGVNTNGSVKLPRGTSYGRPGWYKYSASPGSVGSAVILGHTGSESGATSVFSNLASVRPGNKIIVTRMNGVVAVFQITRVKSYPRDQFPNELVDDDENSAALKLITIGDSFSFSSKGQLVDSLIVSASLVASHRA